MEFGQRVELPPPITLGEFTHKIVKLGPAAFPDAEQPNSARLAYRLARECKEAGWTQDQTELLLTHCHWIKCKDLTSFAFVVSSKVFSEPHPDWTLYDPEKKRRTKKKSTVGAS